MCVFAWVLLLLVGLVVCWRVVAGFVAVDLLAVVVGVVGFVGFVVVCWLFVVGFVGFVCLFYVDQARFGPPPPSSTSGSMPLRSWLTSSTPHTHTKKHRKT